MWFSCKPRLIPWIWFSCGGQMFRFEFTQKFFFKDLVDETDKFLAGRVRKPTNEVYGKAVK